MVTSKGRVLVNSDDARQDPVVVAADGAFEATHTMCHVTIGQTVSGPVVHAVLGNLAGAEGYLFAQLLQQLSDGLRRSLVDPQVDVSQDDGSDPAVAVGRAREVLEEAAGLAGRLGTLLNQAREALGSQSADDPPGQDDWVCLIGADGALTFGTWQTPPGRPPFLRTDEGSEHATDVALSGPGRRTVLQRVSRPGDVLRHSR